MLLPLRPFMKRLGFWELFMVRTGGFVAGYIVPVAGNLAVRMAYLKRRGLSYSEFTWATIVSNVQALFSGAALAAAALVVLWKVAGPPPASIVGLTAGLMALGIAALVVLRFLPRLAGHPRLQKWPWLSGMSTFTTTGRTTALSLALLLMRQGFNFLTFGLLFQSLSQTPTAFVTGGLAYAITSPVRMVVVTPGKPRHQRMGGGDRRTHAVSRSHHGPDRRAGVQGRVHRRPNAGCAHRLGMVGGVGRAVKDRSPAAQPLLSVVIPFRNARGQLPTIVEALKRQTLDSEKWEVLWIDDASRDDGASWLSERLATGWRLLTHPESRGSYAARNTAIRAAAAENVAFTDVDCRPADDWLAQGLAALGSAPRIAGRIQVELSSNPSIAERVDAGRFLRQHRYVEEGFAATANLFVQRKVFSLVGEFDEHLRSGGDHEFGWRCEQAGIPIVYAEQAVVHHPARTSLGQLLRKAVRVGVGIGQVIRHGRMPIGEIAHSAFDRLALVRKGAGRTPRAAEEQRSPLVTGVHLLVILSTMLGCFKGLVLPGAAVSSRQAGIQQKPVT